MTKNEVNRSKETDKRVYIIAEEIKLAKVLAGNNKTLRDRALKRLKRWFQFRSNATPFTEDDFMRIWKGLFYAMWMSDKPLVQEECAEMIACLVHLTTTEYSLMFFKCGLQTLGNEWFGIDQLRLDKFMMLVRRLLRQGFVVLKKVDWDLKTIKQFNGALNSTVLNTINPPPLGLTIHFTEIYLEELAKVSEGKLKPNLLTELISPFIKQLAVLTDNRQASCIMQNIFEYLIRQSDMGEEYEEKFKAWKARGFPTGSIDCMQRVELPDDKTMADEESDAEEETGTKVLDPRAGHVDVILPRLKFIPKQIIEILKQNKFVSGSSSKTRKTITKAIDKFMKVTKGEYPLGIKKIPLPEYDRSTDPKYAVKKLIKFQKKLLNKGGKKRRRKDVEVTEEPERKKRKTGGVFSSAKLQAELEKFINESESDIRISKKKDKSSSKKVLQNGTEELKSGKKKTTEKLKTKKRKSDNLKAIKRSLKTKHKNVEEKNNTPESAVQYRGYDCAFERNSGTWFVYDEEALTSDTSSLNLTESSINSSEGTTDFAVQMNGDVSIKEPKVRKAPKKRIAPITLENSISTPKSSSNGVKFETSEWDVPLKEGETEFFVESKKYNKKVFRRRSFDSQVVKNPFAKLEGTPSGSAKKVKIALNLNKSQDIRDHVAQVKKSPGIPFDADKKPLKPLLKKRHSTSLIDPFYRRKLEL